MSGRNYSGREIPEAERLRMEFDAIDENKDGRVDREEMNNYLAGLGIDEDHRIQIIDELFEKADLDGNNRIELGEFSALYIDTKNQLVEREVEIKANILSNHQKLKQAQQQLAAAKRTHGNYITGPVGVLHISVIRAENLLNVNSSHVICYQGNKQGQTNAARGQSPTYGDSEISFEVDDDQTPLVVSVLDIDKGLPVLESQVSFDDIKQGIVPENKEIWLSMRENDPGAARLRIKLSYVQNEVLKWNAEVEMLQNDLKNDAGILQQVKIFIEQIRAPFGFLKREIENLERDVRIKDLADEEEEGKGDHKYFEKEKKAEQAFDNMVLGIQKKYNIQTIPWLNVTKVVTFIFLALTLLLMLKRPAFLSLTACVLAIYVIDNPQNITRQTFRGLVLLLAVSWVYDFFWLFFLDVSASEEDEEDGGNEYKLRRFIRLISYIHLIFKVIVVLVFWKDSLDFRNIIRGKHAKNSEDDINDILAQYENNI